MKNYSYQFSSLVQDPKGNSLVRLIADISAASLSEAKATAARLHDVPVEDFKYEFVCVAEEYNFDAATPPDEPWKGDNS